MSRATWWDLVCACVECNTCVCGQPGLCGDLYPCGTEMLLSGGLSHTTFHSCCSQLLFAALLGLGTLSVFDVTGCTRAEGVRSEQAVELNPGRVRVFKPGRGGNAGPDSCMHACEKEICKLKGPAACHALCCSGLDVLACLRCNPWCDTDNENGR